MEVLSCPSKRQFVLIQIICLDTYIKIYLSTRLIATILPKLKQYD